MNLSVYQDDVADKRVFKLEIDGVDLRRARLDRFDRALVSEVNEATKRGDATISDRLLALEVWARRIEEST